VRKLAVWLPPQYDGLRGAAASRCSTTWWASPARALARRLETVRRQRTASAPRALMREGKMGPAISRLPRLLPPPWAATSTSTRADRQLRRLPPRASSSLVDREFRTLARASTRLLGKSSGGYGSMIHGMQYAKYWGAVEPLRDATSTSSYWHDWPNTSNELQQHASRSAAPAVRCAQGLPPQRPRRGQGRRTHQRFLKQSNHGKAFYCEGTRS